MYQNTRFLESQGRVLALQQYVKPRESETSGPDHSFLLSLLLLHFLSVYSVVCASQGQKKQQHSKRPSDSICLIEWKRTGSSFRFRLLKLGKTIGILTKPLVPVAVVRNAHVLCLCYSICMVRCCSHLDQISAEKCKQTSTAPHTSTCSIAH